MAYLPITATVLQSKRFCAPNDIRTTRRIVKDYEIDFNFSGARTMYLDGVAYELHKGDLCFRRPGQEVFAEGRQDCHLLTLDFSGKKSPAQYNRNLESFIQPAYAHALLDHLPAVIRPQNEDAFLGLIRDISRITHPQSDAMLLLIGELFLQLNACVLREEYRRVKPRTGVSDRALRYLNENYAKDVHLTDLAEYLHVDKSYLIRIFRRSFGTSPMDYLIRLRMEHARELLLSTDLDVGEIATACGYHAPSHFTEEYKKRYGVTPRDQRKAPLP